MDLIFRSLTRQHGRPISEVRGSAGTKSRPGKQSVSRLHYLGYADDVILFSETCKGAESLLHELEDTAALFGLHINTGKGKTEVMFHGNVTGDLTIKARDGRVLPICKQYKYLGAVLGTRWRDDFARRKKLTWSLLHKYNRVWSSSGNNPSKLHLFHALVVPTLTYSVSSYPWTNEVCSALNGTYSKMLRYALNQKVDYKKFTHKPLEDIMGRSMYLTATIVYNRLREHGHWVRQHMRDPDDNPVPHPLIDVLSWETRLEESSVKRAHGKALRQGPRDGLLSMVRVLTYRELLELAMNKRQWRKLVEQEAMREQMRVASDISQRRFREKRPWSPQDHDRLMVQARENANANFHIACFSFFLLSVLSRKGRLHYTRGPVLCTSPLRFAPLRFVPPSLS
jgi:hypothetical protein